MECQASDNKKLFKVFDASRRKRSKKKGYDETNSAATDDSNAEGQASIRSAASAKASLQDLGAGQGGIPPEVGTSKRERDSSPSVSRSPAPELRLSRSPRHHRRHQREGISLALKPGHVSTPRSNSPAQDVDAIPENATQDQDSLIYAFLEDAIKRDKRKQRHAQRREGCRASRDRDSEVSPSRDRHHRHHRRREDEVPSREHKPPKPHPATPGIDQAMLFQTFAQFCAQMTQKSTHCKESEEVVRTQSHKSLQCEVLRGAACDVDHRPVRLHHQERSYENLPSSRVRSHDNIHDFGARARSPVSSNAPVYRRGKYPCCPPYDKTAHNYSSKYDMVGQRPREDDRYQEYRTEAVPARSCMDHSFRPRASDKDTEDRRDTTRGRYEEDRRRYFEQKTSRSFDVHREGYPEDDRGCRRTSRSDSHKKRYEEQRNGKRFEEPRDAKRFEDQKSVRRFDERKEKYCEETEPRERHFSNLPSKDRRSRRNLERMERTSVVSREEDHRERDRYSERGRDSGLSIADGETSTLSGRSNYLRVVKQEIGEQRDAMDKMMKLWKELMRCFKGISNTQQDKAVHESAATVQESAAAQLRLWRECMRRYETVARDVGDTDARLMEEINKQRSEMAEMANMWQECLQRYRDMSSDFNTLKQQLATSESPSRAHPPHAPLVPHPPPLVCAEGEGPVPPAPYRLPPNYPPMGGMPAGYGGGSPLRSRASAPPPWWWCGEPQTPRRRRSSPDSRGSRDRDRRHRHKERDESRYKEKSSKPNAARSEHRRRKR